MKGILLAGGTGSRLQPLTQVTNKHLLPIYNRPMIHYPLFTLRACGLRQILVIAGREYAGHFFKLLGSGRDLRLDLTYKIQDEAGGIAEALSLAEDFSDKGKVAVILGDNIFEDISQLRRACREFTLQEKGARVILKGVSNPSRFGVATLDGDRISSIEEKPSEPKTNLAVTGFYLYDGRVFDVIRNLTRSARGELEITDVNNFYIKEGTMRSEIAAGDWTDAGTFDSLLHANLLVSKAKNRFDQIFI